ncbi:phytoene desaturase family protein [Labrys wisconsinensis]|uniref:Pyridine nucleotide-disulfide oxidoreductase domain-containing protein 2 n=1 Tax=Labrys wisconsinensis TaxID=425677 RepID=A0ABU0JM18_9HYPH|nr:NAD(P)/FAD-dependent oxidoreductase [Labrys wisconsinensis]MDQ0475341.1 phytoene dehydrogenase-like protein [Labrys wisconsinensis]
MPSFDAVIIGAGHNGLACAALLGQAGRRVLVLEAAAEVGGAARTVAFAPGFRVSQVAHVLGQLHPELIRRLDLPAHGLALAADAIPTTALAEDGAHVTLEGAYGERLSGAVSDADREAWSRLRRRLLRFSAVLRPFLLETPPRLRHGGLKDMLALGKLGLAIRRLGRAEMREFLRMVLMNVADVLEEEIASETLKGAVAFDAVLGTHLGPRSPNSLMTLYYRLAGESGGRQAALALPRGGMGAVSAALAAAAEASGAEIRLGARVARLIVENGAAAGVVLASGEEIRCPCIVSAANPKTTLLELAGARHFDTGFVRRVKNIRQRGTVARLHLALSGLPVFTGLSPDALAGRLLVAPSVQAIEAAFDPAKYGQASERPALEIVIPTLSDPSLAPPGRHVLSVSAIYAAHDFDREEGAGPAGERSRAKRDGFLARILAVLERHAPGIGGLVTAANLMTPADIERETGMPGGHWHHGELAIDQMFMLRPVPAAARYATPLPGLWLCGAGSHPGGGVMGAAALNAAKAILAGRSDHA